MPDCSYDPGADPRSIRLHCGFLHIRFLSVFFCVLSFASFLTITPALAANVYSFDQKFGSIGFSVSHLGLFSSQGRFLEFNAHLLLDANHPQSARISVVVNAASIDMPWREGAALLRSPDFFDVQRYPDVRFTSTSVDVVAPDRYVVHGLVEIRGITQPLVLRARLLRRQLDVRTGTEIADLVVDGAVHRSRFGMTADEAFISDTVKITIDARIQLSAIANAG
jgi:polyisoprenoid-binding protein YceI